MALFKVEGKAKKKLMDGDTKYSRAIKVPQYEPSSKKPNIAELCDRKKYAELIKNINKSKLPDDVKDFLKLGATRHLVFNYAKIADYYAHSSKEVQELFEQSALVIIDMDDAIANGYVRLSENIERIMKESGKSTNEK